MLQWKPSQLFDLQFHLEKAYQSWEFLKLHPQVVVFCDLQVIFYLVNYPDDDIKHLRWNEQSVEWDWIFLLANIFAPWDGLGYCPL